MKYDSLIYGQIEHYTGFVLTAKTARKGQIDVKPIGPTEEIYTDSDAVQEAFTQQRGDASKGDRRELVSDGVLVSTPAGSTAYNLSVHGPILNLNSKRLSISPISAFRPRRWKGALLPRNAKVRINILEKNKRPVSVVADNCQIVYRSSEGFWVTHRAPV